MNPGDSIVIERTANGWMVRPETRDVMCLNHVHVFQDMGCASSQRDYQDTAATLLGFIASHFAQTGDKNG